MRGLFYSFLGYFLTIPGVVLLAALDSSVIFFLPLGIDFGVIILAARKPELFWLYAILATVGSVSTAWPSSSSRHGSNASGSASAPAPA
jgi:hypothetical protein